MAVANWFGRDHWTEPAPPRGHRPDRFVMENLTMNLLILMARATGMSLMLLALAACSESPQSPRQIATSTPSSSNELPRKPDGGEAIDPCTLLTDEEIKRTTGYPVLNKNTVTGSGKFSPPGCIWELKTNKGIPGLHRISIDFIRSGGRERFNFISPSLTPIAGLGDGAVKAGGNTDGTVWAVAGDSLVTLRYALPVGTADPDPLVLPLVKIMLTRH